MVTNSAYMQLINNLEYLKLKQMVNHLDEVIDFSTKNNLSFVDTLIKLTSHEIDCKEKTIMNFLHFLEIKNFLEEFVPQFL